MKIFRNSARLLAFGLLFCVAVPAATACPYCDSPVGRRVAAVISEGFASSLLFSLLPFAVILSIVGVASNVGAHPRRDRPDTGKVEKIERNGAGPRDVLAAAVMLGIGMGGFVDGILFHQILQIHSMLSAKLPIRDLPAEELAVNLEVNMFWDGLFHALTWTATLIGILLLWRVAIQGTRQPTRLFVGGLAIGWGLFNLVEGTIDHHILHLHHVVESPGHLLWDLTFLGSGVLLLAGGLLAVRSPGFRMVD